MKKVMIVAGEASGDLHGANLVREVKHHDPSVSFYGLGSTRMREAGVHLIADAAHISVVGATEVLSDILAIYRIYATLKRLLKEERPDLLVLVDFPGFNIRLGAIAKKLGIPVVYYISPQVWASRKGRIKKIAKMVTAIIVVFPFEVDLYRDVGVDVRYVGHPLTDVVKSEYTQAEARSALGLDPARRTIALLPGSRRKEIVNLLPDMLGASEILLKRFPDLQFLLPVAHTLEPDFVKGYLDRSKVPVRMIAGRGHDALRASDTAIVTSGTATLETGLMAVPMVIIYRVSGFSFFLARLVLRIPHVGLVNIVAGKGAVPELLQGNVSPEKIADALIPILSDSATYAGIRNDLLALRAELGEGGASARAAAVILEFLEGRNTSFLTRTSPAKAGLDSSL